MTGQLLHTRFRGLEKVEWVGFFCMAYMSLIPTPHVVPELLRSDP